MASGLGFEALGFVARDVHHVLHFKAFRILCFGDWVLARLVIKASGFWCSPDSGLGMQGASPRGFGIRSGLRGKDRSRLLLVLLLLPLSRYGSLRKWGGPNVVP